MIARYGRHDFSFLQAIIICDHHFRSPSLQKIASVGAVAGRMAADHACIAGFVAGRAVCCTKGATFGVESRAGCSSSCFLQPASRPGATPAARRRNSPPWFLAFRDAEGVGDDSVSLAVIFFS